MASSNAISALSARGEGSQNLIELALGGDLFPALGVLDDEDHGQGQGHDQRLEDRLQPGRVCSTKLATTHTASAVTTTTATLGREAARSIACNNRLPGTRKRSSTRPQPPMRSLSALPPLSVLMTPTFEPGTGGRGLASSRPAWGRLSVCNLFAQAGPNRSSVWRVDPDASYRTAPTVWATGPTRSPRARSTGAGTSGPPSCSNRPRRGHLSAPTSTSSAWAIWHMSSDVNVDEPARRAGQPQGEPFLTGAGKARVSSASVDDPPKG